MSSSRPAKKEIEFDVRIEPGGDLSYEYDCADEAQVKALTKQWEDEQEPQGFPATIAEDIARALAPRLRHLLRPLGVPHDDALIDQDAGLFDRELYLRLARKGAFPNTKHGNSRVARWGDVKAAFIQKGAPVTVSEPTEDPEGDLLNEVRQRAGLAIKGGR